MKKNLLLFFSLAMFATMVTVNFTACVEEDLCENVNCGDNGTCFDGNCVCDLGFVLDPVTGDCVSADPCESVTCGDNSLCVDGDCLCDGGFEKDANDECVLERDKFFGLYEVLDICPANADTFRYDVVISDLGGTTDGIKIQNLGDFICEDPMTGQRVDYNVESSVLGETFSFTGFETCNTIFEGDGVIVDGVISISYKASFEDPDFGGIITEECFATLTKR